MVDLAAKISLIEFWFLSAHGMTSPSVQPNLQFGPFEVDLNTGELRKYGIRIHIQEKPLRVLATLAARKGQLVTRSELQKQLWPDQTYVDFEDGLNTAVRKLRDALCDDAEKPLYIETVPRHGYRFIAELEAPPAQAVQVSHSLEEAPLPVAQRQAVAVGLPARAPSRLLAGRLWKYGSLAVALVVLLSYLAARFFRETVPPIQGRIMVAVLPVENLSGDASREYISDGLTEEIITQLSRYNPARLGVIARTSSMVYKSRVRSVAEIGRELRVDYVVENSMRASGDKLRVTSQLVRVSDQTHLWSATYERSPQNLFNLQDEIAQAIALNVRVELANASSGRLTSTGSTNPDAHLAYLEGRYYWNRRSPSSLRTAVEHFKRAIQLDGNYAQAYTGLADAYSSLCLIADAPPKEFFPLAKAAALKAVQLDDGLAEAHNSLGYVKLWFDWDWAGAEAEFKRAIDLNPGYATAHQWYAEYLRLMGRQQDAIAEGEKAFELDPLSLIINMELGLPYYYQGHYDEALMYFRKTSEMDPSFGLVHCELGWTYEEQGKLTQAIEELQKAAELDNASPILASLGHAYARAGRKADALKILDHLQQRARSEYVGPNFFAFIYSEIGEDDKGMDALERAYADRHWGLVWMKVANKFDSLRPNPRYQALLQQMKFPN